MPDMLADPTGKRWYDLVQAGGESGVKAALEIIDAFSRGKFPKALEFLPGSTGYRTAWDAVIKTAEKYNDPGRFTAFIGYEWTSQVPPGNNLHRVVIYRDGADKASQTEPYTTIAPLGSTTPEDLWKVLQAFEDKTGGRLLAIAHNGNLSNGWMFPTEVNPVTKQPFTKDYAQTRSRWEPLYEATQVKGDGETHPLISPNDEMVLSTELWDKANLNMSEPKKPEMLPNEYARTALQIGLQLEQKLGTNPYKFGMIGSTDSHTSLVAVEEDNFFGKHSGAEPDPHRWEHRFMTSPTDPKLFLTAWQQVSSGFAGVWAQDEHPRVDLGRDEAQGNLRHHRLANDRALLRRLGLQPGRRPPTASGRGGVRQRCPHGWRPARRSGQQGADLPRRGPQGSPLRESRSDPDHQGLGGRQGRAAGEGLRRRMGRRRQAQARRQAASFPRSATPSTWRTRPGRTRSATPS